MQYGLSGVSYELAPLLSLESEVTKFEGNEQQGISSRRQTS